MARRPARKIGKKSSSGERERRRSENPTVMTAAGLLAFYEEEEALFKIKPLHVILVTIGFMAVVVALTVLGI